MKKYTRVCARVDLDAVGHNVDLMHRNLSPGTGMIAVVKADGYGHGAVQIARFLEPRGYVWGFAAATLEEAVILKKAGIQKPLIVLGCIFPDQWESMIEYGIRMTCYSEEAAREVSALAARMGRKAYIHIKLDTGMSRLGFPVSKESVEGVARIAGFPNLVTEGMDTHIGCPFLQRR